MTETHLTAARPPFVYWTCIWAIGVVFGLVAVGYDIFRPDVGVPPGRDFSNLYTAGQLVLAGEPWAAFDLNLFRLALREHVGTLTMQNYSYPPHALFIAVPFAVLPYWPAFVLFSLGGAALFVWAARPYVPFAPILAVLTPAAALNLWNGHYGLFIGALWLIFFRYLHDRPGRAGFAAAALTFKPHMGLFIALAALTERRTFIVAALATVLLVVASVAAFGPSSWYGFFIETAAAQADILTREGGDFYFKMMPSAYVAFGRGGVAWVAQAVASIAAIAMLVRARRTDAFTLATATFIVVPYVFVYDMTVVCLGFAILLWRDWETMRGWEKLVLTAAFFVPDLSLLVQPVVPPILLAAFTVQLRAEPISYRLVHVSQPLAT